MHVCWYDNKKAVYALVILIFIIQQANDLIKLVDSEIIIGIYINTQVQEHHPHQWAPL